MKKVTLQAVVVPGFNKVLVKVQAQTHTGVAFGTGYSNTFVASNGLSLISNNYPARDKDKSLDVIYVQGADASKNDNAFVVGTKLFGRLKAAVEEYNRVMRYAVPAPKPAPKPAANPCICVIG